MLEVRDKVRTLENEMSFETQSKVFIDAIQTQNNGAARASTIRTYESLLKNHILPQIGALEVGEIKSGTLKSLAQALIKKGLKPASIQSVLTLAKLVVASAVNEDGDRLYPRDWNNRFINAPEVAAASQKAPIIDIKSFQDALGHNFDQDKVLWALLAGTGLRIGEALAIVIKSEQDGNLWDFADATITVRATIVKGRLQPTPKTAAGKRIVDLDPRLNELLKAFVGDSKGFLFESENGDKAREQTFRDHLPASIPGFHSLRRFRVTYLRRAGVPENLLEYWVGHARKSITDRYDKVGEDVVTRKLWATKAGLGFDLGGTK